jgi:hypothetical protein
MQKNSYIFWCRKETSVLMSKEFYAEAGETS